MLKICMIGAGSLGSAIGGTLALGGQEVTFIDPYQAHMEAIAANGRASSPRLTKKALSRG